MSLKLCWDVKNTAPEITVALRTLAADFPFSENGDGMPLRFTTGDKLKVTVSDTGIDVTYRTMAQAMRGAGMALGGVGTDGEDTPFQSFGVMLDVSRNAVMKISYAKSVLARLSLMGYNLAMLYTEDTYLLPDQPDFGYLRGAYSLEEVQELDDYANKLGIELIGCIQTLGHMTRYFHTVGSQDVRDTDHIFLVGEEKTYALIRKMFEFYDKACRSRRIHLGMDEAWGLGSGAYKRKNGERSGYDIFMEHMTKIREMCKEFNFEPMIWSDMYFRLCSTTHNYYDTESNVPENVKEVTPRDIKLVYWDYYHLDPEFYDGMIRKHRDLAGEPLMGSALWTWYRFCYDYKQTIDRIKPCLESCRRMGVKDFFFTMWGDDGAYCDFETVIPGLLHGAELAYGRTGEEVERLDKIAAAMNSVLFSQTLLSSRMNYQEDFRDNGVSTPAVLIWDDLLYGIGWRFLRLDEDNYRNAFRAELEASLDGQTECAYSAAVSRVLLGKINIREAMLKAYKEKDMATLRELSAVQLPELVKNVAALEVELRRQWKAHYKYEGLEVIQIRLAGVKARTQETIYRLEEFVNGETDRIAELEAIYDERCFPRGEAYATYVTMGSF